MQEHSLFVLDTHVDIPWNEKTESQLPDWRVTSQDDVWSAVTSRRVTFPKARQGGLGGVCLAAYIPQAELTDRGHDAAWKRVQAMLESIHSLVPEEKREEAAICSSHASIYDAFLTGKCAIIPVVENGYPISDDPSRIAILAQRYGVRYMTLTHNGHNLLADSAVVKEGPQEWHGGVSALGKNVISEMNTHGVIVDVSHASKKTMMQAAYHSRVPIVASHSCIRSLCDHPRNLDDEQLDLLKETGGVIQITAMGAFLKKGGGGTLKEFVQHIQYAVRRIGIQHVGISSDFDGGGGIPGWEDARFTRNVVDALREAGFSAEESSALCGGNMLRLFEKAEQEKKRCQE